VEELGRSRIVFVCCANCLGAELLLMVDGQGIKWNGVLVCREVCGKWGALGAHKEVMAGWYILLSSNDTATHVRDI